MPVIERAPSKDNIEKYLEEIGAEKKWMRNRKTKKWKLTFPMLSQLNDLLNKSSSSRGRAKLCAEHLKMAEQGKTMKDADVEWQTMRYRRAPNPKREQHDARVLKRIENILFKKGEKGETAWRYGPVSFITLEIPKPATEQVAKGEETERKIKTIRQRLHSETDGKCIYCNRDIAVGETEMDHIVPKARGGPDIQQNRIASCRVCNHPNSGKGDQLPSEWLTGQKWAEFEQRVNDLQIDEFKKSLLLLPKGESFPEDPTSLARAGARSKAFIMEIIDLFKKYGVEPPTYNYEKGKPHIQLVGGRLTSNLRRSWLYKDKNASEVNFPEKERTDLYNHAQDAAILAAVPPHTWRNHIFIEQAMRPCAKRGKEGEILLDENGRVETELRMRPGIAHLGLAPDWAGFMEKRTFPIVWVLGKLKANWKRQIMDQSSYRYPKDIESSTLCIRKNRQTVKVQKGGLVIQVPHNDRTTGVRKVQVTPIQSVSAIIWHDPNGKKGNVQISLKRPKAIKKFVSSLIEPPIPEDAKILGELERGQTIKLQEGTYSVTKKVLEIDPKTNKPKKKEKGGEEKREEGFYRIKELSLNGIKVIPENCLPDILKENMNIKVDEGIPPIEINLGKTKLAKLLFGNTSVQNKF